MKKISEKDLKVLIKRILKEDRKPNEFDRRYINLVGKLINKFYPNFTKENVTQMKRKNDENPFIEYLELQGKTNIKKTFAKYWVLEKELQLNRDIFEKLEIYFGDNGTFYVTDWFNDEFGQDAETVSF